MKKTAWLCMITCVLCLAVDVVSIAANQSVFPAGGDVYILNSHQRKMDAVCFIENNRVFVPVRYLAYACELPGEGVTWNELSQTVMLKGRNQVLMLKVGSNRLDTAEGPVEMDVVPQVIAGRIYLPARWVAQYFGYTVEWDAPAKAVLVYLPGDSRPQVLPTQQILLVNKVQELPQDFQPGPLVNFGSFKVAAQIQQPLQQLCDAAIQQGIHIAVNSAYRSRTEQKALFNARVKLYGAEVAQETVGPPGHSEHETGLAVDFGGDAVAYSWLEANGPRYGFILRYPNGKEYITGYTYEPWHFRYIGVPVATFMQAKDILTLEEFVHNYAGQ